MKFWGLILLFISAYSFADCRVQNGRETVVIRNGETKTLFQENGSLTSLRTQDQDGLGTCYANTTSVVLKSVLPGNPDISYTHAAVQGSTRGILQDWREGGTYSYREGGEFLNFTHGGSICNTVDALKNNGGACPTRHSVTENKTLMDPNTQQRLFYSVGRYFDELNRIKNDPAEFARHRERLSIAFEAINLERDALIQDCRELQNNEEEKVLPLGQAISDVVGDMMLSLGDSQCDQQKFLAFRGLLDNSSTIQDDRIIAKPSSATIQRIRQAISTDVDFRTQLQSYISQPSNSREVRVNLRSKVLSMLQNFLRDSLPACEGTDLLHPDIVNDVTQGFLDAAHAQFRNPCAAILSQPAASDLETFQCFSSPDYEVIVNALGPLLEINQNLDSTKLQAFLDTRNENANQLRNLFFPECETPSNLVPMNNISCRSESMCAGSPDQLRIINGTFSGPPGGCLDMNAAKNVARAKVLDGVRNNRAIGISVCSGFLYAPSVRSNFCTDYVPGPSVAHDMTVSGYRCTGDKIEYQVINSWGTSCPPGASDPSGSIKCDPSENGKLWIDEEVLINNTTSISEVKGGN